MLKKICKKIVVLILYTQLSRLRRKNNFKVIGVVGSFGKTSTKFVIANVLSKKYTVRYQAGNYNDIVTVPLVFFNESLPSLLNPLSWILLFLRNERAIYKTYRPEIIVLELGTDGPGQIVDFGRRLDLDIAVITSLALEHMENFGDLDSVASEELAVTSYSDTIIFNKDLCPDKYMSHISLPKISYGFSKDADAVIEELGHNNSSIDFSLKLPAKKTIKASFRGVAKSQLYSIAAAAVIADKLNVSSPDIAQAAENVQPVNGRMNILSGLAGSILLDDSYNSSPEAAIAALDVLYGIASQYRIAVLGNMNELGKYSEEAHKLVGNHCDPKKLELVITIGDIASDYLAPAAKTNGCVVKSFNSPYEAGVFLKSFIKPSTAILFKGSQNKVFAEETVKLLLKDPKDQTKLVRQSPYWLKQKAKTFTID